MKSVARLMLLDLRSWKSPPSIGLRVIRKPKFTGRCQRSKGKKLIMTKKNISTPSALYLK
jgi:hypothetical protein